ncbi:MAG TPA: hypothetical protein VGO62_02540 [Myxococcota bacterium]
MTLPVFLAAHLIYGVVMAHLLIRRMRAEGEVIGVPLVVTMAPIGLLTAPLSAVLLRYAGGWFLHGFFVGDGNITYERFQLGLMLGVMFLAAGACVLGMFAAIAALSRDAPKLAVAPIAAAVIGVTVVFIFDWQNIVHVRGAGGRLLVAHPAGLVSLAIVAVLTANALYVRARVANVLPRPVGPASLIVP